MVDARAERSGGEGVGPGVHGREHVGEGGLKGTGAEFEFLGELFRGKFFADEKDLARGPVVVGENDVEKISRWHGRMVGRLAWEARGYLR